MRRKGVSTVPAIFFLIVIAIVAGMFIVPIFGSIDEAEDNQYTDEFEGVSGIVDTLYKVAPLGITALALLVLTVAVICFTKSGSSW